jgi:predicted cupin superfamily sugar epimerase
MATQSAADLIKQLDLAPHPEGGWYRETYRSEEVIAAHALPEKFTDSRSFCTAIYFLLEQGDFSALHRIKSDELWHFYAGTPLTIHVITAIGHYQQLILGEKDFQTLVPAGSWFGAEINGDGPYALVGCTVSPGFDFADFEMGDRNTLLHHFPAHAAIIRRLTKIRLLNIDLSF